MSTAERTDPKLWETVKDEVTEGEKGGRKGQWSARKAQLAVSEYKKRGGEYEGEKREDNNLHQWTEEDWGTKSGKPSEDTGERYLPKAARDEMSDSDYARTTRKKRADTKKGQQHSAQPEDVAEKSARHRQGGNGKSPQGANGRHNGGEKRATKAELMQSAREKGISGRSKMSRDELAKAVGHRADH